MLPDFFVCYVSRFLFGNRLVPMTVDMEHFLVMIVFGVHIEIFRFIVVIFPAALVGEHQRTIAYDQDPNVTRKVCNSVA